jgi:hypothetical protein
MSSLNSVVNNEKCSSDLSVGCNSWTEFYTEDNSNGISEFVIKVFKATEIPWIVILLILTTILYAFMHLFYVSVSSDRVSSTRPFSICHSAIFMESGQAGFDGAL